MKLEKELEAPLQFSLAAESDFEEVVAMSEGIYGGLDYLPSRYHAWLCEPQRTVVLAKRAGAVIGLQSVAIIDSGETALVEGLRVAPWERGKGVAGELQRFCAGLIKQQHPGVKVLRLTRDDPLGPKDFRKYRIVAKQAILHLRFEAPELLPRLAEAARDLPPPAARALAPAELRALLLGEGAARDLLPGGLVLQDWQPYRPLPANLPLLTAKGLLGAGGAPGLASLSAPAFAVPRGGAQLSLDAFGGRPAPAQLPAHLLLHLDARLAGLRGAVACQLCLAPELWDGAARFCRDCLGLPPARPYAEQVVLEADL